MAAFQQRPERSRLVKERSEDRDPGGGPLPAHEERAALFVLSKTAGSDAALAGVEESTVHCIRRHRLGLIGATNTATTFMVSRLTPLNGLICSLRALAAPDGRGIRAVIAGEGEERPALERLVSELGLEDRVTLAGGVTEAQLLDHLARCRVVCFARSRKTTDSSRSRRLPLRKPVVTCTDSGGPAELVADGERGATRLQLPTPEALARRSAEAWTIVELSAERMGAQALAYVSTMIGGCGGDSTRVD